jgi:DNA mismatch repair protein MutH
MISTDEMNDILDIIDKQNLMRDIGWIGVIIEKPHGVDFCVIPARINTTLH